MPPALSLPALRLLSPALLLAAGLPSPAFAAHYQWEDILPSRADPGMKDFDFPSIALRREGDPEGAPLVVFMPGTGGRPAASKELYRVVADQGYRVLGLAYNDEPAVAQVCPRNPDPGCSAAFRAMRVSGPVAGQTEHSPVQNPAAESIEARLAAALKLLAREHPEAGWGAYLDGDQPRWSRLVLSGLSQGAGMAAFMAQRHAVRRVVLFSSPWDFHGRERSPAPWLDAAGLTPPARWHAEYNARENTVPLIRQAYARLKIPPAQILVFNRDLPPDYHGRSDNPFHAITTHDTGYAPQWRALYGRAEDPAE